MGRTEDRHYKLKLTHVSGRSPCPMLNTLANHGYVARDGKNISLADMQDGFAAAINLEPAFSVGPFGVGVTDSTTGRNDTLNLHDLLKHNLIEHDASFFSILNGLSNRAVLMVIDLFIVFHEERWNSCDFQGHTTQFANTFVDILG